MNNRLKIISGKYKSRLIDIPDKPNLRPSKAYIRETLFNVIEISLCKSSLDLFSGSGILSFEALSRGIDSATLIEREENNEECFFGLQTIGEGYRNLIVPYGGYRNRLGNFERTEREEDVFRNDYDGYMNGSEVFKFSITYVPKLINTLKDKFKIQVINKYVLHQANLFIIKNIAKRIKADMADVPISIDNYGNTGAATIPLTICSEFSDTKNVDLSKVLICGFGIGLSLGAGLISLNNTKILPIRICEEVFYDNVENLHNETTEFVKT